MIIEASNIGKKFGKEWIFRKLNLRLETGQPTAITGPNGSGKSTLLQILSAQQLPSEGTLAYTSSDQRDLAVDDIYQYIDIAAPYLELIEEFTLNELIHFHFKFKQLRNGIDLQEFKKKSFLEKEGNKPIKSFSSGMKQRLKLALCFFSNSAICLLDEPTTNLDQKGMDWYKEQIEEVLEEKLIVVSSNQIFEYDFCLNKIDVTFFK
jgi:ABC-type multidrug transport system ATPase subunit